MNFYQNGIIIQDLQKPTKYADKFKYVGVNAFHQYPLCGINDDECKELTKNLFSVKDKDGFYYEINFITDFDFAQRYINVCWKYNLPIRVLFIESTYFSEIWKGTIPVKTFLGFEYCEIPFDSQVITDLNCFDLFQKSITKLNSNGLFENTDDVLEFQNEYDIALQNNLIGDGDMDTFICKVYEVDQEVFKL